MKITAQHTEQRSHGASNGQTHWHTHAQPDVPPWVWQGILRPQSHVDRKPTNHTEVLGHFGLVSCFSDLVGYEIFCFLSIYTFVLIKYGSSEWEEELS